MQLFNMSAGSTILIGQIVQKFSTKMIFIHFSDTNPAILGTPVSWWVALQAWSHSGKAVGSSHQNTTKSNETKAANIWLVDLFPL